MGYYINLVLNTVKDEKIRSGDVSSETLYWAMKELLDLGFPYGNALDTINNL